jgi:hypothetical protein
MGTKMVMITRNARKKLSPRSSAQKGNSGFSVCLRIVLFFQPPFFFADAYIELLPNSVVCLCGLHGFPPRRVIRYTLRRAQKICPSERSRFAADANLARALGMPNLSGAKDRAKCYDVN